MQQYFEKRNLPVDGREVKNLQNRERAFAIGYTSILSVVVFKVEPIIRQISRQYQRSAIFPFILLLASILTTFLPNADALQVTSRNMNTVRFAMKSSQVLSKFRTCKYVSHHLPELGSYQQNLSCKQYQRSSARLFSQTPRYSDRWTLSDTGLSDSTSFCTSLTDTDTSSIILQENRVVEIISNPPQNLIDNRSLQDTKGTKSKEHSEKNILENVFSFDLPEGKCVGLRLNYLNHPTTNSSSSDSRKILSDEYNWIEKSLHADEVQFGINLPTEHARMTFYVGRLAIRTALRLLSEEVINNNTGKKVNHLSKEQESDILPDVSCLDPSILKDKYGRPQVPEGYIGSISHKKNLGVALVSSVGDDGRMPPTKGVGIDIEQTCSKHKDIAKKVLTKREIENLGKIPGVTRDEEVLLRFSLKECVYKAMHPLICQFVGFQEAEVTPNYDGTATIHLNLKSGAHENFQHIQAHWRRIGNDFFLTSSSVVLKK